MVLILLTIIVIENMPFKMRHRAITLTLALYSVDYVLYHFKLNFGIQKKIKIFVEFAKIQVKIEI